MNLQPGDRVWLTAIRDPELVHMAGAIGTVAGSTTHPDWPGIECRTVYFDRWPTRSGLPWGVRADDLRRLPAPTPLSPEAP
jgi:hypothetical protein